MTTNANEWTMIYGYAPGTFGPSIGIVSGKLPKTFIECGAAIQEMRWIRQECKFQKDCNIYYSCHAEKREFGCGFTRAFDTLC